MWETSARVTRRRVSAGVSQRGSCRCQTSVWPWTRIRCASANATSWSAGSKRHPCSNGWTASHFIAFSGVIALNSRTSVAA